MSARIRRLLRIALLTAALPGYLARTAPAEAPNLVVNGDFSLDADGNGVPDGWAPAERLEIRREDGASHLFLDRSSTTQRVDLDPSWWHLTLTMKMRATGVVRGAEGWQNARLAMSFHDADGNRVGDWPNVFFAEGTSDWIECRRSYPVPPGAAYLSLNPANFGPAGTVEFADLRLVVERLRQGPNENVPLPVGAGPDPFAMDRAFRNGNAVREEICLNGLWNFRPALEDEGTDVPGPTDGWGWFKVPGMWPDRAWDDTTPQRLVVSSEQADRIDIAAMDRAWYRRPITVPEGWGGRRILLDLRAVQTHAAVRVDGKPMGDITFPGGRLDLTEALTPGTQAELAILLTARPFDSVTNAFMAPDRVVSSKSRVARKGLTGDVFLVSEPPAETIRDVHVITSVADGRITLDVGLEALGDGKRRLEAVIRRGDEEVLRFASGRFDRGDLANGRFRFDRRWKDAELWDTDTPDRRYRAVVTLTDDRDNRLDETLPVPFGFREFFIRGKDFYLNGSRIHLRALHCGNVTEAADRASYAGCRSTFRRMKSLGFNAVIAGNYSFEPGQVGYAEGFLQAADDEGMAVAFSLPHIKDFGAAFDTPEGQQRYRELCAWLIRQAWNHPSVILYAMNHNATGYYGDQNPLKIDGTYSPEEAAREAGVEFTGWSASNRAKARIAADIAATLDPTRPIYHHQSGNLGDLHTVNIYLNWAPPRERSNWLDHWAREGRKPVFFVEWGLPHISSFSSYRGPLFIWTNPAFQAIWDTEFAAAYSGDAAYRMTPEKVRSMAYEEELWARGEPFHWGDLNRHMHGREEEFLDICSRFAGANWRDHRARGASAMLPWDQGEFHRRTRPGAPIPAPNPYTDINRPGIVPDTLTPDGQFFADPGPEDAFAPTSLADTFRRVNMPLLAFIGGDPDTSFTDRAANASPGDKRRLQLVIVNDTRREQTCTWTWNPGGGEGEETDSVRVAPGDVAFVPVSADIPKTASPGTRETGARFEFADGTVLEDRFALRVLPQRPGLSLRSKIALYDPKGQTARLLKDLGVRATRVGADLSPDGFDILIIGREALEDPAAIPGIRAVRKGLRVLVFEQRAETLQNRLGFRVNVHGLRQVFPRVPTHPVFAGLTAENLADWRGAATLTEPYLPGLPPVETTDPTWLWCGFRNTRVWRCGNDGNVASVLIEKPSIGSWMPLADGGFDLQYAPLLECTIGEGRVVFCQLDVTGRTDTDPAAERLCSNLLGYLDEARNPKPLPVTYSGDPAGAAILRALGIPYRDGRAGTAPADGIEVVGAGSKDIRAIADRVRRGGTALCLGLPAEELKQLGGKALTPVPGPYDSETVSSFDHPVLRGLCNADLHVRGTVDIAGVEAENSVGNRAFRVVPVERGRLVVCAVTPGVIDADAKPYRRTSARRNLFLIARALANLGAAAECPLPERLAAPPRLHDLDLSEGWVGMADPEDRGRDEAWYAPDAPDDGWRPLTVPGTFDSQFAELADYDGLFWYRLRFAIPGNLDLNELTLHVGPVDDESSVWLNGTFLGEVTKETNPDDYWSFPRSYPVDPAILRADGENVLTVRVNDTYRTGGLTGKPRLAARPLHAEGFYVQTPVADDDPYRYYRW